MKRFLIGLLAILAVSSPALARDNAGAVYLVTAPAALNPGSAYLLLRTSTAKSGIFMLRHVLLRIPSAEELAAYRTAKQAAYTDALPRLTAKAKDGKVPTIDEFEYDYPGKANTFVVDPGKFIEDGEMRTILIEVPPGTYVIYGSTLSRGLVVCNCLGTVQFAANAGVITDMGSLYLDKVHKESPVPHLEDNLGPQMFQYGFILGQAVVPADATTPVPAGLRALAIEQARFEAVGQFYEPGAGWINRLPPIPGILSYDRGRPVDLRTGKRAE